MAQRQFRSDDTSPWADKYGNVTNGAKVVSSSVDYDGANAGCSGTVSTTSITSDIASTFANGMLVLIHQSRGTGVGAWELNKILSGGGSTSLTMAYALTNTYTDSGASQAQILELKQYSSVTVNGSQTWTAPNWDGNKGGILAFVCNGITTVTGTISAAERGCRNNAPQPGFGGTTSWAGEGTIGDRVQQTGTNGTGGGGTLQGTGFYPSGGGGGHATTGGNGTTPNVNVGGGIPGTGGLTGGVADLTTMIFGGSGGSSAGISGGGGASGGIILIISKTITITGSVLTNGGAGQAAGGDGDDSAAGGGGSAGSVLFKGQIISLGSTLVSSAAGSGGNDPFHAANGGNGSNGRNHADYLTTPTGTTFPTIDTRFDPVLQDSSPMIVLF